MITPTRPTTSCLRKGSLRKTTAMISLAKTPTQPPGATSEAGAKPYASRLPSSPKMFMSIPIQQSGTLIKCFFGFPSSSSLRVCASFWIESATAMVMSAITERIAPITSPETLDSSSVPVELPWWWVFDAEWTA